MKKVLTLLFFFVFSIALFAQNEEAFQEYLSKIRPVLTKNVEKITQLFNEMLQISTVDILVFILQLRV